VVGLETGAGEKISMSVGVAAGLGGLVDFTVEGGPKMSSSSIKLIFVAVVGVGFTGLDTEGSLSKLLSTLGI